MAAPRRWGCALQALGAGTIVARSVGREALSARIHAVCRANDMSSGVHIRLVVSRGEKTTPYQSPAANRGGATVVIIPEWKEPDPAVLERGLALFTVHVYRGAPDVQVPIWNSLSKLNCITAQMTERSASLAHS